MQAISLVTSPFAAVALAVYGLWLLLTICNQFDGQNAVIRLVNSLIVIPRWTFFAPRPGIHDYHLLYRIRSSTGEVQPFREIPIRNPHRSLSAAVWNHRKRLPKMLADIVTLLTQSMGALRAQRRDAALLKLTFYYLVLLHIVGTYCQHEEAGCNVQFALVQTEGHLFQLAPEVLFSSDYHPVQLKQAV